ncbi:G-type lectin S-receptor-like serine/threonine-protein kinase [Tanacetum coccineum]
MDLRANNIFLDESMCYEIAEFGMAIVFKQNEIKAMTKRVVETLQFVQLFLAINIGDGAGCKISSEISFGSFNGESYKNIHSSKRIFNGNAASTLKNGKGSHTEANNNLKAEALVHIQNKMEGHIVMVT